MKSSVEAIRYVLEQYKGRKKQVEESIATGKLAIRYKKRDLHNHEKAREIVREAGLKTQESLSYHISEITSLALDAVFGVEAYQLLIEFVQRRNKTECDILFTREGENIDPLSASGGGAVDVASFALRIASWSMQNPKSRNVVILDEPLKWLSLNYQEQGSEMLKEISQRLGIQFIIVTHNETLASFADKTFEVGIKKGKSFIK